MAAHESPDVAAAPTSPASPLASPRRLDSPPPSPPHEADTNNSNNDDQDGRSRASASSVGAAAPSAIPETSPSGSGGEAQASRGSPFECSICFDVASEPVVTPCGHLFCWPCLFAWMERQGDPCACPVCKASVAEAEIVPLYARHENTEGKKRGETNAPPRPRPRSTTHEAHHHPHEHDGGYEYDAGPHVQMRMFGSPFGMGMFGFGPTIGFQAQWPPAPPARPRRGHGRPPTREQQRLTEEQQRAQMQAFLVVFIVLLFFSFLL